MLKHLHSGSFRSHCCPLGFEASLSLVVWKRRGVMSPAEGLRRELQQEMQECRPSRALSNCALGRTDETLLGWPCLVDWSSSGTSSPVVDERTASSAKVAGLCPTGYKNHFAKEKALIPVVFLLFLARQRCWSWRKRSALPVSSLTPKPFCVGAKPASSPVFGGFSL